MIKKKKKQRSGKKINEKSFFEKLTFKIVCISFIICCTAISISTEYDRIQKEEELLLINEKIRTYQNENAELKQNLESNDVTSYIEKVALEDFNYAYPDERRFYDTSRN